MEKTKMPMNKQTFDEMKESDTNQLETRKKRCNWEQLQNELNNGFAYTTDDIKAMSDKYTVDGKQMSRLRCRNWLLNKVKANEATRKFIEGKHYYSFNRKRVQTINKVK